MRRTGLVLAALVALAPGCAPGAGAPAIRPESVIRLFNGKDLGGLYTWLKDANYEDPRGVFTVENGLLHISGDGLGYIATKERYRDYHLVVEYRWGPRTWGSRIDKARDSGVIVHCVEPDGSYGNGTFMAGIEAQIIDGGTGDFIVVGGRRADGTPIDVSLTAETAQDAKGNTFWRRGGRRQTFAQGRINWFGRDPNWVSVRGFRGKRDVQSPDDQWTRLEVLCMGDEIVQCVNGVQVNAGSQSVPAQGKILLQCELAEIFIRRFELWPIDGPAPRHDPVREVTLNVDCGSAEGALRRGERFISDSLLRPPMPRIVEKLLADVGACAMYRSWIYVDHYWDPDKDSYDFDHPVANGATTFYRHLDNIARLGDTLLVDLRGPPLIKRVLAGEVPADKLREAVKRGLAHYKRRCPKLRYLEVFSEMRANAGADIEQYYDIYRHVYRAVNDVNAELRLQPGTELLVGGPGPSSFSAEVPDFIRVYARDADPKKRLDFIVYHDYDARRGFTSSIAQRRAEVDAMLRENGITDRIPIFATEMGCFPAAAALGTLARDQVTQAACMSTLFHYYNRQPDTQAFHWVVQHFSKERKTLIRDDLAWTPYGCALKMQKLHRREQVHADAAVENARGVFSLASRDETGVVAQLWNYQHAGNDYYRVTLRVANLPECLAGKPVRGRLYQIDSTHSNLFRDARQRDLQCTVERTERCGSVFQTQIDLEPNALALVELMPAPVRK